MGAIQEQYKKLKEKAQESLSKQRRDNSIIIQLGSATCEHAAGSLEIANEMKNLIKEANRADINIKFVGCTGRCDFEPIMIIFMPGKTPVVYQHVDKEKAKKIFNSHILGGSVQKDFVMDGDVLCKKEKTAIQKQLMQKAPTKSFYEILGIHSFYSSQSRVALRNVGIVDPKNIYEYIDNAGFEGLVKVLEKNDVNWVINEVNESALRGRGGAGFPTGKKWNFVHDEKENKRYMICNADEGDPGAFMDRGMLESDPFSIIEGMIIAGFSIAAQQGYFYVRAEYPLAVERIQYAIEECRKHNILGKNILGSNFSYDLEIKLGAGAFVCGEETALIHSIEGERGQPRTRPPFPANSGLWGKPTIINNVETLANLPVIFTTNTKKYHQIGTEKSGGTKVFAVSGKIKHTGLVEVPFGTTLKEIVFDICGGVPNGKKLKAVQTGGPAGGCIPAELMDTKIDYESLMQLGSMVGSGGLIVMDEDDCMVDVAKYFITFSQNESCGKCSPCREGTLRMLEILERITKGNGKDDDIEKLERLGNLMRKAALCGLGKAAANPVLSTLKYFKKEYEDHIFNKKCAAKKCTALVTYTIDQEKCVGCMMCAKNCPVSCIHGEAKKVHVIDQKKCIKCGRCFDVCPFNAVKVE